MNKRLGLIIVILAPFLVGLGIMLVEPDTSLYALVFMIAMILGYPFILGIGVVTHHLTRKSSNNYLYTLLGYGLPGLIVILFETGILEKFY